MKKFLLLTLLTLLLLTGCRSKTSFSLTFDEFTIRLYDNGKQYTILPPDTSAMGMEVLTEMKEAVGTGYTGTINSILITKMPIQTGIDIKELVDSNAKQLQVKLLKYKNTDSASKKVKCDDLQYSGYMTAFSYQLDSQTLYDGQFFFTDEKLLYILSLSSDEYKDITSFIKSISTLKCIQ